MGIYLRAIVMRVLFLRELPSSSIRDSPEQVHVHVPVLCLQQGGHMQGVLRRGDRAWVGLAQLGGHSAEQGERLSVCRECSAKRERERERERERGRG